MRIVIHRHGYNFLVRLLMGNLSVNIDVFSFVLYEHGNEPLGP
jgi:hypothetical protein